MPVTPTGTSTVHYLYPGVPVKDATGDLQENVGPIEFAMPGGAALVPRNATTQVVLTAPKSDPDGFTPEVLLPSDGGPVLARAAGGRWSVVPCSETITPAQFAAVQAAAAAASAKADAITAVLGADPAGDSATVTERLAVIGSAAGLTARLDLLEDRVDALTVNGGATHSHDVDDITDLHPVAKTGEYGALVNTPGQLVKFYLCVNGQYQAWDPNVALGWHFGPVNPGGGRPGSLWTPQAENFPKFAF